MFYLMRATERNGDQYVFSSAPTVPREKAPDILVKFQAVSREHPCLRSCSLFLSSKSSLLEIRKIIHSTFAPCYEKGFIFLRKNKEVVRSRERILRLFDILPRPPPKVQNPAFRYQNVQYKKLTFEKDGRRYASMCCGMVFLYEDSGLSHWIPDTLNDALSAPTISGLDYIPWSITSAREESDDVSVYALNEYAALGKERELRELLDTIPPGTELQHFRDSRAATPLHYAAQNGHVAVCELLIGRFGREILYMKDTNKRTPLHCALTFGKFEDSGFDKRQSNEDGRLDAKLDVVCYLLQLGPDLQCQDVQGLNCYWILFTLGNKTLDEVIRKTELSLLDDKLILHLTCYSLQYRKLEFARDLCKLVKVFDAVFYLPPLHLAAEVGEKDLVESLLRKGDRGEVIQPDIRNQHDQDVENTTEAHDPKEKDRDGHLPFHYACQHGNGSILSLLYFDEMSDADFVKGIRLAVQWKKTSALQTIVQLRDLFFLDIRTKQMVIYEVEENFSVHPEHSKACMACLKIEEKILVRFVSQAARVGDIASLNWLVEQGTNLNHKDIMGRTPLHEAAQMGHTECIQFLLASSADPNDVDWRGSTALHYACMSGQIQSVNALLQNERTVPNVKDVCGRTPLLVAAHCKKVDLLKILVNTYLRQLDPHAQDMKRRSVLHYLYLMDVETAQTMLTQMKDLPTIEDAVFEPKNMPSFVPICEVWRDQTLDLKEKRRKLSKQTVKTSRMRCKKCRKTWTVLGDRIRWLHLCKSDEALKESLVSPSHAGKIDSPKKTKVPSVHSKKEYCEEIESLHGPFKTFKSHTEEDQSLPQILILMNRHDLLELVANIRPELLQNRAKHAALLAACYWHIDSLKVLMSFLDASQELIATLFHLACLQKPLDSTQKERQISVVNYLIEEGAHPNIIPKKNDLYSTISLTSYEKRVLYYSPLELGVINQNASLVEVLVKHGASSSICFAVHLAAVYGDVKMFDFLLKEKKEEGDSIIGTIDNVDELWRVCSLGMGIIQALCSAKEISLKHIHCVMQAFPDSLQSKKLLTRSMVLEIRPDLDISSNYSILKCILFKFSDRNNDISSLPHTWLANRLGKKPEIEYVLMELLKRGLYLDEVRVSKKSTVHISCDMFMTVLNKRCWVVADEILRVGGTTLWQCLLTKHHSCHRHVYKMEKEDAKSYPVLFKTWNRLFGYAPLSTLKLFFQQGLKFVNTLDLEHLEEKLSPLLKESRHKKRMFGENILTQIASHHIESLDVSRRSIFTIAKLLILFPRLFPQVLDKTREFQNLNDWMTVMPRDEFTQMYGMHTKGWHTIKLLRNMTLDRKLLFSLTNMGLSTLDKIENSGASLLHLVSVLDDVELLKAVCDSVDPLPVCSEDALGATCLDYAVAMGHEKTVGFLLKNEANVSQQTLLAVCVGARFLTFMQWKYTQSSRVTEEERQTRDLRTLSSTLQIDVSYHHPVFGNVLRVAIEATHWKLVQFILESAKNISTDILCDRLVILPLIGNGPWKTCCYLFENYGQSLMIGAFDLAQEALFAASVKGSEQTALLLFKLLTSRYESQSSLPDSIIKLLTWENSYEMTTFHSVCQQGNIDFVKYALNSLGTYGYSAVQSVVNVKDHSQLTPLWYALANRHFSIAELVLLHGGILSLNRSVPDLWPKRVFTHESSHGCEEWPQHRDAQIARNDSTRVAEIVSPRTKTFQEVYTKSKRTSPIYTSVMEHHVPKVGPLDTLKRKVQYLLDLSKYCQSHSSSILHGAAAIGDHGLLQEMLGLTMSQHILQLDTCPSPLVFAVANHQYQSYETLLKKVTNEPEHFYDILALAALETTDVDLYVQKRKRKSPKERICKDVLSELQEKEDAFKIFQKLKNNNSLGTRLTLSEISLLVKSALKICKSHVPNSLLSVLACLGKVQPLQFLQQIEYEEFRPLFERKISGDLLFTDLLFMFTNHAKGGDVKDRVDVLRYLANEIDLTLNTNTIEHALRTDLFPMLHEVVQDYSRKDRAFESVDVWIKVLYDTSKKGNLDLVTEICHQLHTRVVSDKSMLLYRSLCLACYWKRSATVDYFLAQNMRLQQEAKNVTVLDRGNWVLDFAILSGSSDIVQKVLDALDASRTIDSVRIRESMELASNHANNAVIATLVQSRMVSAVLTKEFTEKVLLRTAARGQEKACVDLLNSRHLDVRRTDQYDNSVLHYACTWNMMAFIEVILNTSKDDLNSRNNFGHTPLDLARSMGHIAMANHLVNKYKALATFDTGQTGWLKYLMMKNESAPSVPSDLMPPYTQIRRLESNVHSLVSYGDDHGTLAIMETLQEKLIQIMIDSKQAPTLFHLCAIYGCKDSLKFLLTLTKAHAPDRLVEWLHQVGTPPLIMAMETRHVSCVKLLEEVTDCYSWRSPLQENVLHLAARIGNPSIAETVTVRAPESAFTARDKGNLIPLATAVAYGNHHILQYLCKGGAFEESSHATHKVTDYSCVHCLMDSAIGWSKMFQSGYIQAPNVPERNILDRKPSRVGFWLDVRPKFGMYSLNTDEAKKKRFTHPLDTLYTWSKIARSNDVMFSALATMGYGRNIVNTQLFLLNKEKDVLQWALKSDLEDAACFYFQNTSTGQENIVEVCCYAAQAKKNKFFMTVLEKRTYADLVTGEMPSPLEVALAYGNMELVTAIKNSGATETYPLLQTIQEALPVSIQWRVGVSQPGDYDWQTDMDNSDSRMSLADVVLTKSQDESNKMIIERQADPEAMIPMRLFGKELHVDLMSFERILPGYSKVQTRALVLSKLILGRYSTCIDTHNHTWKAVSRISVSCIQKGSIDSAQVLLSGSHLQDKIQVSIEDENVFVLTGEMPTEITTEASIREHIDETVTKEMEHLVKRELNGLSVMINVDWDSLIASKNMGIYAQVIRMLSGDVACNKLGGLQSAITRCGSLLGDIKSLCGRKAVSSTAQLYSNLKEITVKYVPNLPILKAESITSNESSMVWYFTVRDGYLRYNSDHFMLLKLLTTCRSGYNCLLHGFRLLTSKPDVANMQIRQKCEKQKLESQKVEATIEWDSFESIGMVGKISGFIRGYAAQELQKIAHLYAFMMWLHFDFDDVCLRVTRMKDRSGIWFKKKTLVVSLKVTKTDTGVWMTEDTDYSKVFHSLEEKQILDHVVPFKFEYPHTIKDVFWPESAQVNSLTSSEKLAKATINLQDQLGIMITVSPVDSDWLKIIHTNDIREMTHPLHLIGRYYDWLAFGTWYTFTHTILSVLQAARTSRYLGDFNIPAGAWTWVTHDELQDIRMSKVLLVRLKQSETKKTNLFKIMKLSEIQEMKKGEISGIWQHISFNHVLEDDSAEFERVQLISINKKLMFLCDRAAFKRLLLEIPHTVNIKPNVATETHNTGAAGELGITCEDVICRQGYFYERQNACPHMNSLQFLVKSSSNNISAVYDVWDIGSKLGTNVVFDNGDFEDDLVLGVVGYVMQKTLEEIANLPNGQDENRDAILSTIADIGHIRIGFKQSVKDGESLETVEGTTYNETVDIHLLSERDLYINFKPNILDTDLELRTITDTLISAVCRTFEFQTPFFISDAVYRTLGMDMLAHAVTVFKFHGRKNKEEILSAAVQSRVNISAALKTVAETDAVARQRLISELVSLEVKETSRDGSVATFENGNLRFSVLKDDGNTASQSEVEEDLLSALKGRNSTRYDRSVISTHGNSYMPMVLTEELFPDNNSVMTISSPPKVKKVLPKVHRLKRPTATSRLAIQKATDRLFDFVEFGHTGNIENVLDIGANINAKNLDGFTPLIRAAELRNYVVQNLLLSHGADVSKTDKVGRTPLHIVSAHGDVESIKLLLTHGINVNSRDKNGRTPLHYAVNKKKVEAVDILVFCGADSTIKDKMGNTPSFTCKRPDILRLMQESTQTVFGMKNGYVFIEHTTLEADSTYHLKKLDLTIKTPHSVGTGTVNFIGRRVRPEYSRSSLVPADKELLMSDVFEYRLSGTRPEGHVTLKIPVYAKPDLFEEVYMKTDRGVYISFMCTAVYKQWFCYVKMNISNINAFLLVTLPKVEKFPITPAGGVFTSSVDSMVEIKVLKETFIKSGTLTLEVIPKPAFDEEEFSPVLSLSHFYDVNHSKGEQPRRDVLITMPTPQDYFGDGDLYVMLRHDEVDHKEEEDCWEILEKNPAINAGLITIKVPHFSDLNLIEYKQPMEDGKVTEKDIIRTNAKLLEKAKRRECSVVFMAMLRPMDDSNCEAVVECTRNTRLYTRLQHWKMEGYKDQKPSFTNEFISFPKQEFLFDIGGNSQKINSVITKLQYHPKRDNYLTFPICAKDETKDKVGWVDIGEKKRLEKEFAQNPTYDSLAKILVYLADFDRTKTNKAKDETDTTRNETTEEEALAFAGFTDKNLLQDLASRLGPEWMRLGILLGFTGASIDKLQSQEDLEETDKRLKMLTRWRDLRLHRSDHGVPELLIVLQKSHRRDLVTMVIAELKKWLDEKKERQDKFYSWLESALTAKDSPTSGLLEPMSDAFLQALVDETGVVLDLAGDVDVSRPELDTILADPLVPSDQAKMVKVLQTCRDKQNSRGEAFKVLTEGLTSFGLALPRNWMLRTAKEWIHNTELSDDPFVHAINDYLEEVEKKYLAHTSTYDEDDISED
ncbi:LOW QUALITY PROTEIN: uncharacterized protein LOC124288671 [Haliotis rubra]|uniref:LOW QUALITY PROTEIN: uncharacterized protein LOC124288671 n=1 Tax=Haliotis rubra TaxID=36100 RepID=UPI001EE5DB4F|nr:LOW QUALITY PROTEIN: uncharacterized protein LOC124288671 [Haliotis rubra]